jgi:hypothetical protein
VLLRLDGGSRGAARETTRQTTTRRDHRTGAAA